jgi:hypothetical protein
MDGFVVAFIDFGLNGFQIGGVGGLVLRAKDNAAAAVTECSIKRRRFMV